MLLCGGHLGCGRVLTNDASPAHAPPRASAHVTMHVAAAACPQTVTAVVFYAPWCQECVNLEPEFRRAAQAVATMRTVASDGHITSARLVQVDGSQHHDLAEQYRITLFPTMLIFHRWDAFSPMICCRVTDNVDSPALLLHVAVLPGRTRSAQSSTSAR